MCKWWSLLLWDIRIQDITIKSNVTVLQNNPTAKNNRLNILVTLLSLFGIKEIHTKECAKQNIPHQGE